MLKYIYYTLQPFAYYSMEMSKDICQLNDKYCIMKYNDINAIYVSRKFKIIRIIRIYKNY